MQDFIQWLKEDLSFASTGPDTLTMGMDMDRRTIPMYEKPNREVPNGNVCSSCGVELSRPEIAAYGTRCEDCAAMSFQTTDHERDMNQKVVPLERPDSKHVRRKMDWEDNDWISWLNNQREKRVESNLNETDTRYSVEVNYRTKMDEVLKNYAKICLGYASAGLKRQDYHVRQVFEEAPFRILVSSRNWDDGEWVGVVSWNESKHTYIVSCGFYNKDRKTVSIQKSVECDSSSAAEIVKEVINLMHGLKDEPDRHVENLKRVSLKRGRK